ncbi:MAG: hypothetical protein AAF039_00255 [Bacteroidota bacterium]
MKKILFLFLALSLTQNFYCQVETDKVLHFLGGNLFGLAGAGIAKQASNGNRWWTFAGAVGGSALVGIGKEAIDAGQRDNSWDNADLLATILGGVTVGLTIDVFTNHKKDKKRLQGSLSVIHKEYKKYEQYTRLDGLLKQEEPPTLRVLSLPLALSE